MCPAPPVTPSTGHWTSFLIFFIFLLILHSRAQGRPLDWTTEAPTSGNHELTSLDDLDLAATVSDAKDLKPLAGSDVKVKGSHVDAEDEMWDFMERDMKNPFVEDGVETSAQERNSKPEHFATIADYDKVMEDLMSGKKKEPSPLDPLPDFPLQGDMPAFDTDYEDLLSAEFKALWGDSGSNKHFSLDSGPAPIAPPSPTQTHGFPEQSSHRSRHHHRTSSHRGQGKVTCEPTPIATLKGWMGPAFNTRYMSIDKPRERQEQPTSFGSSVLLSAWDLLADQPEEYIESYGEFAVNKSFRRDLPEDSKYITYDENLVEKPSGDLTQDDLDLEASSSAGHLNRKKRGLQASGGFGVKSRSQSSSVPDEPWHCETRILWEDLGDDYFPRYLRIAQCAQSRCYMQLYGCREKAFTIKVLRRISDECIPVYGNGRQPIRYEHQWVFEERAVPFCCECAKIL